ncbi:MAG TPA: ATP-binding protein [Polyangiaceae bacterium]|jgi:serine/threonine-protein kinase RsbT|nr:ATP-binding protein [Polyangiaceae bacterium]
MSVHQRLVATLQRYVSSVTTETIVNRALHEAGLSAEELSARNLEKVTPHLERGIRLFVAAERQAELREELTLLGGGVTPSPAAPSSHTIPIKIERDISDARLTARELCIGAGSRALIVQKVATIVSELARNIASYTPGGQIELAMLEGTPRRMQIRAIDKGRGITNLDAILDGRYKSRTGLGKGLLGVKRLAESFDVQTGATGTRIEVVVSL